jgi:hypothetical protein
MAMEAQGGKRAIKYARNPRAGCEDFRRKKSKSKEKLYFQATTIINRKQNRNM